MDNIEVFEQTLDFSDSILYTETMDLKKNTEVIIDGSIYLKDLRKTQVIRIVNTDTVRAILDTNRGSHIAVLNFADALEAGGLVWEGESTQEEHLCRCSNLYKSLKQDICRRDYYDYNWSLGDNIFSNRIIYSPNVTFFKDANYSPITDFIKCDIISSPAPIACKDEQVFIQRIKCILGVCMHKGVDTVILGSWGCGAFSNDPTMVASAFKQVLDEYKCFDKVIFAIKETPHIPDNNYEVFKEVLV